MKLDDITSVTAAVTKKWTKQRKKEERESRARLHRSEYVRMYRMPLTEAALKVIPAAYAKVSDNGRLPAHARQIFYAARPKMEEMTGKKLDSVYFTQTLLPQYMNRRNLNWRVVYDARGHLIEPHTEQTVPLGTIEVDSYLHGIRDHKVVPADDKLLKTDYPTKGPVNRYSAILFIEKEGFHPLFEEVKLAQRYDLAIMSTKGQSVTAGRKLVDHICHKDIPVLILHDLDAYGMMVSKTLVEVSESAMELDRIRYAFRNDINFIDVGLHLDDVEKWSLESEPVSCKKLPNDIPATDEEREFLLRGQRVELNAFTSADFIAWIEEKLAEHGIKKVVPDHKTLVSAYRRAYHVAGINQRMEKIADEAREAAEKAKVPKQLRKMIEQTLAENPEEPWDAVLARIAEDRLEDYAC